MPAGTGAVQAQGHMLTYVDVSLVSPTTTSPARGHCPPHSLPPSQRGRTSVGLQLCLVQVEASDSGSGSGGVSGRNKAIHACTLPIPVMLGPSSALACEPQGGRFNVGTLPLRVSLGPLDSPSQSPSIPVPVLLLRKDITPEGRVCLISRYIRVVCV